MYYSKELVAELKLKDHKECHIGWADDEPDNLYFAVGKLNDATYSVALTHARVHSVSVVPADLPEQYRGKTYELVGVDKSIDLGIPVYQFKITKFKTSKLKGYGVAKKERIASKKRKQH